MEGERVRRETARLLGARVAEADELYTAVPAAPTGPGGRRVLAQLAAAGGEVAEPAWRVRGGRGASAGAARVLRRCPRGVRVRRRASNAGRMADRITAWAQRGA